MSAYFLPAAISTVLLGFHLVAGRREIAQPLLASQAFPPDVKYVLYICWHVVSLLAGAFALAYIAAAIDPALRPYAIAATILAGVLTVWSFTVVVWKRQNHREMPQWIAFMVLTLSGLWALG
jgi:hypothetical protein